MNIFPRPDINELETTDEELIYQITDWFIPETDNISLKIFYILFGIMLVGIGSALYITCGLGTGPRDGLMTGLHYRTGVRVGRVRLVLEVLALSIGFLLGGTLGIGTALFALLIGQSVAVSLGVVSYGQSGFVFGR